MLSVVSEKFPVFILIWSFHRNHLSLSFCFSKKPTLCKKKSLASFYEILQESYLGQLCTSLRERLQRRMRTQCMMCESPTSRSIMRRSGSFFFFLGCIYSSISFLKSYIEIYIVDSTMRRKGNFDDDFYLLGMIMIQWRPEKPARRIVVCRECFESTKQWNCRDLLADDPTIKLEIKGDKVIRFSYLYSIFWNVYPLKESHLLNLYGSSWCLKRLPGLD